MNRTVAHRMLKTLREERLVMGSGGRYWLGPEALLMGAAYIDRLAVRRAALPYAVDLQRRVVDDRPWTVSLAVPADDSIVLVDRVWGAEAPLSILLDIGTRLPLDGSVSGCAVLAGMDAGELGSLLGEERSRRVAPALAEIRARGGLSTGSEALRPGVSAMASAIRIHGTPAAALVIAGPHLDSELWAGSPVAAELLGATAQIGTLLEAA